LSAGLVVNSQYVYWSTKNWYSLWRITYNKTPPKPRWFYLAHAAEPIPPTQLHYGKPVQFHCILLRTPVVLCSGCRKGPTALACLDAKVATFADGAGFAKKADGLPGAGLVGGWMRR
jgi:hypothetical protein